MAADNFNDRLVSLYSWIRRQAYRYYSNEFDIDDLTSETIYKLLKNKDKFDNKRDLKPWILLIMQNTYITDYNHRRCIAFVEVEDNMLTYSYSEPQSLISIKNIVSIVRKYARQSCCIESVLLYAKGYNYDEISRILDIPIGTVRSRISSGRKLRCELLSKSYLCIRLYSPYPMLACQSLVVNCFQNRIFVLDYTAYLIFWFYT